MKKFIILLFALAFSVSLRAQYYDIKESKKTELFPNREVLTVNTPEGTYIIGLNGTVRGATLPSNTLMSIKVYPPANIDPWGGKLKDRFALAPGIGPSGKIIYHDLESQGKQDFCSIIYDLTIEKGFDEKPEVYYFEMRIPDDVADEILKLVLGETKWEPDSRFKPWYKFVNNEKMTDKPYIYIESSTPSKSSIKK